jgi:hypothetical protein
MWRLVIERLATAWGRDVQGLRKHLKRHCYGLPRGRVTRPEKRFLILHGRDAPVKEWLPIVLRKFDLERRSVKVLFDEHEVTFTSDRLKVREILGVEVRDRGMERDT